jgi:hypothetical protein
MTYRTRIAGLALAAALLIGGGSTVVAGPENGAPNNCFGQHVSDMARMHGGMAAATAHHNQMHGTDLTVGEHMAMMRDHGCQDMHE